MEKNNLNLVQSALVTDMPFYGKSVAMDRNVGSHVNTYDHNFSMLGKEAEDLFSEYKVSVPDRYTRFESKNSAYLRHQLEANRVYNEAEKNLDDAGFVPEILAHAGAAIVNPINYATGAGAFKLGSAAFNTLITAESRALSALGSGLASATATVADVGIQELSVEKQTGSYSPEKFTSVVVASSLLGGGLGGLAGMLSHGSRGQAKTIIDGVDALASTEGRLESVSAASNLEFSIAGNLRNSHKVYQDEALNLIHSNIALKDGDGNLFVQDKRTAHDVREEKLGSFKTLDEEMRRAGNDSGMKPDDYSFRIGQKDREFVNKGEQTIWQKILDDTGGDEAKLIEKFTEATGVVPKKAPDDLMSVVYNHYVKQHKDSFLVPDEIKPIRKFYKSIAESGTVVGLKGVAGKVGDLYSHRMWNTDTFDKLPPKMLEERLVEAMQSHTLTKHYLEKGVVTAEDLAEKAKKMIDAIKENNLQKEFEEVGFISKAGSGSPLKQRVIMVDESKISDLIVQHADVVAERYIDKMAGRLALKEALNIDVGNGTRSLSEAIEKRISDLNRKAAAEGATRDEIIKATDNLRAAYGYVLGTRKIVNNPSAIGHKISSTLRNFSSAVYSSGFVKSAVGELGSIMVSNGYQTLKSFVPSHAQLLQLMNKSSNKDAIVDTMLSMNLGTQINDGLRFSRMDLQELKSSTTWYERNLQKMGFFGRKWSGFNAVTAGSDIIAFGSTIRDLQRISETGTVTKKELEKYSRYGLTKKDILSFNEKSNITYKNGHPVDMNFDSWADQAYVDKLHLTLSRAVNDTVLRGNTLNLPRVLSDVNSDVTTLLFQYQHFPVEAYERLLLRGIAESPAKLMAGTITSMIIGASMIKLTDEALYQTGVNSKRIEDSELFSRAFGRVPMSAFLPDVYNMAKSATGQSEHYSPDISGKLMGASGSLVDKSWRLYQKIVKDKSLSEKDYDTLFLLTPFSRFPVYNEAMRGLIKETE